MLIHITGSAACQQEHQEMTFFCYLVQPRPVQQTPLNPTPPPPPTHPLNHLLPIPTVKLASVKLLFARFDQGWQH